MSLIFLKANPWFNTSFKFIISIKYVVLCSKLATGSLIFSFFVLPEKKVKWLWVYLNYQDIER